MFSLCAYFHKKLYICLLTALEALLVPFQSTGNSFLRSIDGFATFGAFWMFHRLERHFYTVTEKINLLLACISLHLHLLFVVKSCYAKSIRNFWPIIIFLMIHGLKYSSIKKCSFVEYTVRYFAHVVDVI